MELYRKRKTGKSYQTQNLVNERIRRGLDRWLDEEGYADPDMSVADVALYVGVSTEQLEFFFRTEMHVQFRSFRKQLRIERAQLLLIESPELPVSVIGKMVGINDRSVFRRQFHEITGLYPTEWRERRNDRKLKSLLAKVKVVVFKRI